MFILEIAVVMNAILALSLVFFPIQFHELQYLDHSYLEYHECVRESKLEVLTTCSISLFFSWPNQLQDDFNI